MNNLAVAQRVILGSDGLAVPAIGAGNIWLVEDYTQATIAVAQEIIVRALGGTAPGDLEVVFFDYSLRGVAAPFSSLSDDGVTHTLLTEDELSAYFVQLKQHILSVHDVMQASAPDLLSFRQQTGQALESFRLVVIAADFYMLDERILQDLRILLSSGPRAGVSFLIISPDDADFDDWRDQCYTIAAHSVSPVVDSNMIVNACEVLRQGIASRSLEPVRFKDVEDLRRMWHAKSADGVTFSVGMFGLETYEVTVGSNKDQRHNVLITGAVGQGKSNLLAVIVHSLCQRYAPWELELYMLDFKEGVTLRRYAAIDQEDYLPHARALGLEADVDFGIAVLEHLYRVYKSRMRAFKLAGVQNIKQYRELTGEVMPRIVVVIDEFQMMLEDRRTAREVVDLLSKSVRLYRAAGIHFILASQTIANGVALSKDSDIFAQTPIRIAHRNSARESEAALGMGNVAASDLRMGEAIVNLDYGAIASNRKVRVALADDDELAAMRHAWWIRARAATRAPAVFDGGKVERPDNLLDALRALREEKPALLLGKSISVEGDAMRVSFTREMGRNLGVFGAGEDPLEDDEGTGNAAIGTIGAAMLSLAYGNALGTAQFVLCNLLDEETSRRNGIDNLVHLIERLGFCVELVDAAAFTQIVKDLNGAIANRSDADDDMYLVCLGMERMGKLSPEFSKLAQAGPMHGVHFLTWWQKPTAFEAMGGMGKDGAAAFDIKVLLRLSGKEVRHMIDPFCTYEPRFNRALVLDGAYLAEPVVFLPFYPLDARGCGRVASSLV